MSERYHTFVRSPYCYTVEGMKRSLQEVAEAVGARLRGNGDIQINGVASISSASRDHVVFVEDPKHLEKALQSAAGAVIAGEFAVSAATKMPLLICEHPKLAFARAASFLQDASGKARDGGVHPTAVVHISARLSAGVCIEERAVLGEDVHIGEDTRIGAGCAIGRGVKIGRKSQIYPNVTIYPGTTLGDCV